ncbi:MULTISPECIES: TetR/AcrR family transcriptional regulator [Marinomonas]|uniref:TetR/AcrR family transcriptional regulator n=1 Tax=Marinomonas TaxID=28253 RepID=UPI0007AFAA62|nr:TetR/AcrR family transcriptional regulator [Marinomonas sp. TW1]KZN13617.1 TetR family transcriptional regulator [Marinomonas sp. TW1]
MSKKPRFDRQQVIEKATNLYWGKGYHATSMRHLQDAIDMRPGSIYAEFGSKDGVFKAAIEYYVQVSLDQLEQLRAQSDSPLNTLQRFVRLVVIESRQNAPSSMCLLAKTVAELTEEQGELFEQAKAALKRVEDAFAKLMTEAQQHNEISKQKDPQQLARLLQIQITGLRVYAKTCDDIEILEAMIEDVFAHSQSGLNGVQ